ncbi:MAG: hypothetical protein COA54_02620 [Thiotrichaceae bacterium]|nr:MAG: hypothetical protein COA54_02620 [Thiotrichaceae bacterium]
MFIPLRKALQVAAIGGLLLASSSATAGNKVRVYDVTITNLTNSITFTPILVASHRNGVTLFEAGSAASEGLTAIAEGGDTAPLAASLSADNRVAEVKSSGGLLGPGESVTVEIKTERHKRRISVASMMLPTNDGFIAIQNIKVPKKRSKTVYSPGYDAGTEPNDEVCANIPGPTCGGEGLSPEVSGEGYVHINRGIHGIGDLAADVYDWRNPVAKITITRK